MKKYTSYITSIFLMLSMLTICGCASKLSEFVVNGFAEAIENKANSNLNIAKLLSDNGFLSEESYNDIKDSINEERERLLSSLKEHEDDEAIDVNSIDTFADTCRAAVVYSGTDDIKLYGEYYDDSQNLCYQELANDKYDVAVGDKNGTEVRQNFILGNAIYRFRGEKSAPSDPNKITYPWDSKQNWILLDNEPALDAGHDKTSNAHYVNFIAGRTLRSKQFLGIGPKDRVTVSENEDSISADALNAKFQIPIYALDATTIPNGQIDAVLAMIHEAVANDNPTTDTLYRYFTPVTDENNKPVTLMGNDFQLIVNSEFNPEKSGIAGYDYIVTQDIITKAKGSGDTDYTTHHDLPQCAIKFHEFSQEAANELIETLGLNRSETSDTNISPKYYIHVDKDGYGVAYLMDYPVSPIASVKEVELNGSRYAHMIVNDSAKDLYVNIMSGALIVKDLDSTGAVQASGHVVNSNENIKLAFGSGGAVAGDNSVSYADAHAISSFIVKGCRPTEISFCHADGSPGASKVLTPRIVLTDYMESTWAPGLTDENLVVFGRKIRFLTDAQYWKSTDDNGEEIKNSVGDNIASDYWLCYPLDDVNNKIAYFIDNDSNQIGSLNGLSIYDFCGLTNLLNERVRPVSDASASEEEEDSNDEWDDYDQNNKWTHYTVDVLKRPTETYGKTQCTAEASETNVKIDQLSVRHVKSFGITQAFPGTNIGKVDVANHGPGITRFYAICTRKGMFDSALYSDWINSTSKTASLAWWNDWLDTHGYVYRVEDADVEEYLSNNYRYELSQNGAVILDLTTVAAIQDIYDKEEGIDHTTLIRTIFIVLGYIILAYSMILMLCWIVDTHTDLGLSIVNKLTFGHWTAVAYESDLPSQRQGDKSYVDGKHMFIRCIILVFIAIILIIVDVNKIILVLVEHFGELAKKLNDIIQGVGH